MDTRQRQILPIVTPTSTHSIFSGLAATLPVLPFAEYKSTIPPLLLKPEADFSRIDMTSQRRELEFQVIDHLALDPVVRELRTDVLWFQSAREHVYSVDRISEFLKGEDQKEFPTIRFTLNTDMSLMFGADGQPSTKVASHGQMTKYAFTEELIEYDVKSIVAGSVWRRIENDCMIIEGGDNQSSGFKPDFNKLQLFFIALFQSQAYQTGLIRLDETKELEFKEITRDTRTVYYITADKLIARISELTELYAKTILSTERIAEYTASNLKAAAIEVPLRLTENEYRETEEFKALVACCKSRTAASSSYSSSATPTEQTEVPFRKQPPPTPSRIKYFPRSAVTAAVPPPLSITPFIPINTEGSAAVHPSATFLHTSLLTAPPNAQPSRARGALQAFEGKERINKQLKF
jgi:hypothetical protein